MSERATPVDLDRGVALARELAVPRLAGSAAGRRTVERVAGEMRRAGLEVAVEELTFDRDRALAAVRRLLVGVAAALAAAGWLLPAAPLPALAALLAAAAAGLASPRRLGVLLSRPGPVATANVVGRHRPLAPRRTVILVAHHDSKSQSLSLPWRMGSTLLALAGTLGVVASLAAALAGRWFPGAVPAVADALPTACGLAAAAGLLLLATMRTGDRSPGGVDNAGSLALLLELARRLPAAGPGDVEWIFLSPGAEEDYMIGARRFLDRHRDELAERPVTALNFDGAGNPGPAVLIERHGLGRLAAPELSRLARRVGERLAIPFRGVAMPPGIGIDAIPFCAQGIPCVSWASGSLGRATLAIHSPRDVADNLDRDALGRVAALGFAMALEMASERA